MHQRNESRVNGEKNTRLLSKSELLDENMAQGEQASKQNEGKEVVYARRTTNAKGLVERSLNVISRSFCGTSNAIGKRSTLVKPVKPAMRFGGRAMLIPSDCADDIDSYLRFLEDVNGLPEKFLDQIAKQNGVNGDMRQILVDWLVQLQHNYSFLTETVGLAVFIMDRALLRLPHLINKGNLQLLGVACIFVAAKYEEVTIPTLDELVYLAANAFTSQAIVQMELLVLQAIEFKCSVCHSVQFLRRYRFFLSAPKHVHNLAKFFSEVALVAYPLAHYKPSVVAAVSLYLSAFVHKFKIMVDHLCIEERELVEIGRKFVPHVLKMAKPNGKLCALYERHKKVALLPFSNEQVKQLLSFEANH